MNLIYKEIPDSQRATIPTLAYEITTPDVRVLDNALSSGYRHLVCECSAQQAFIVSRMMQRWTNKIKRQDLFFTIKVNISNANRAGYKSQFMQVLKDMDCGYIDLLALHNNMGDRYTCVQLNTGWKLMETLYKEGHARQLGVSNFSQKQVESILDISVKRPTVFIQEQISNSSEESDLNLLSKTLRYCKYRKLCPLQKISSKTLSDIERMQQSMERIAQKHKVTNFQVLVRWLLEQEYGIIWQGVDAENVTANFKVLHFALTQEEHKELTESESQTWTL